MDNGVVASAPKDFELPRVWEFTEQGGKFGSINRPYAGARSQKELPVGEHSYQLYSLGTPNGQKVTILLEELGVEYDAWRIPLDGSQFTSGFVDVNPNSKIPAMLDRSVSPPVRVFESGSILLHLAEKHQQFIPQDPNKRVECINWLFWQVGSAPLLGGGFGHFYMYAPLKIKYAIDRYAMEAKRQLDVLDKHLVEKQYLVGDEYTIADIATFPWIRALTTFYKAAEFLQLDNYTNVQRWLQRIEQRPAVKRGLLVNGFDNRVPERHSKSDFDGVQL